MTQQQKVDNDKRILGHMSCCECICWHVDTSWQLWGWCKMLGVSVWVCSLERLAGEGACLSGRPRNRLFSNVQLPIIPAVINHPTLTNEVEQSASQSATQHTTTHQHRPDGCPSLSSDITLTSSFECCVSWVLFESDDLKFEKVWVGKTSVFLFFLLSEINVSHGHKELHF